MAVLVDGLQIDSFSAKTVISIKILFITIRINYFHPMDYQLPMLTDRVKYTLIDLMLILLLMGLVSEVLNFFPSVPDWVRITIMLLMILYDPIFTSASCTLGQKLVGIRVRNYEKLRQENKEERINFFAAVWRIVVKYLIGAITYISFFINGDKRMIHDFASGSIVIKKRKTQDSASERSDENPSIMGADAAGLE